MEKYDVIVIGSGVGLTIMSTALARGLKVAMIENDKVGGTCLTRGCIPSKVLIYPADIIREAQHAKKIGVDLKLEGFDWDLIAKRMWHQIDESKLMDEGFFERDQVSWRVAFSEIRNTSPSLEM